jgi:FkbM family methyltransferase
MNIQHLYRALRSNIPDAPERFEKVIRAVYQMVLTKGSVAIDVGAHTGKHTLDMADAVGPNGEVYAFEPITEKFIVLSSKISKSHLTNIHIFNVCCHAANSTRSFIYLPERPGQSSLHIRSILEQSETTKRTLKTLCISLDAFFPEITPAFIKIDSEGAELDILYGARTMISQHRPIVHVELGLDTMSPFGYSSADIWNYLFEMNYIAVDITGLLLSDSTDFYASLQASGVYDYILLHAADNRLASLLALLRKQWLHNDA